LCESGGGGESGNGVNEAKKTRVKGIGKKKEGGRQIDKGRGMRAKKRRVVTK